MTDSSRFRHNFFRPARPLAGLAVATLLLAACGGGDEAPADAPATTAPVPAAPEQPEVDSSESAAELLERANAAVAENRLFEPPGENAVSLFLAVIERSTTETADVGSRPRRLTDSTGVADPAGAARLALADLFPYGLSTAQGALTAGRFDEAERVIALLARVQPEAASLRVLTDDLAERRAAAAAAAAQAAQPRPVERPSTPPSTVAESTPPPAVTTPAAPPPAATPPTQPAARGPAGAEADPVASREPPKPAQTAAEPAAPTLVAIERVAPRYPRRALQQRRAGWVVLSFRVLPNGSVDDIDVTDAKPRGVFEREAIAAMERWRFQPVPVAVRSQQQFDFNPEE